MNIDAQSIRDAVQPFVPGWQTYPEWWNGSFALFQAYTSAGVRIAPTTVTVAATAVYGGQNCEYAAADVADAWYLILNVPLRAGTYSFAISYRKASDFGKFDLYVNSAKESATALDCYASSSSYNNQWDVADIVIAAGGWQEFKILCASKNASSSDYRFSGGICIIRRTA